MYENFNHNGVTLGTFTSKKAVLQDALDYNNQTGNEVIVTLDGNEIKYYPRFI